MYATAKFDFDQANNGWLMSEFAFMRSIFLIFMFPRIIDVGRRRWTSRIRGRRGRRSSSVAEIQNSNDDEEEDNTTSAPELSPQTSAVECDPAAPVQQSDTDTALRSSRGAESKTHEPSPYLFDLVFLRWSLIVDGAFTAVAAFATKSWHIYLGTPTLPFRHPSLRITQPITTHSLTKGTHTAAFLLPFGSGSAPAAKGVITEMCPESQRADALSAVTLIENVAKLATQGLFGFVFASLAQVGKAYATFFCNAVGSPLPPLTNFPQIYICEANPVPGGCCGGNGCALVFALSTAGQ